MRPVPTVQEKLDWQGGRSTARECGMTEVLGHLFYGPLAPVRSSRGAEVRAREIVLTSSSPVDLFMNPLNQLRPTFKDF